MKSAMPYLGVSAVPLRQVCSRVFVRTDPEEVRHYVAHKESRLSGLSRREALKHIKVAV